MTASPNMRAWYCKGLKKTGKPILVDVSGKEIKNTKDFKKTGCLKIRMKYNNAHAAARQSGATTVLEVTELPASQCGGRPRKKRRAS